MQNSRILLVEGVSDQYFFSELLRKIEIAAEVRITSPKDHGSHYNNKGGVFATLPLLLRQMNDGMLDRVATVVDADHDSNGGMGYKKTIDKISTMLDGEGFTKRESLGNQGGFIFKHSDGLNPIGLWVMPDNKSNGGLEEWAVESAKASEAPPLDYAKSILSCVPGNVKYSQYHECKAQVSAWMAWQRVPGQGLQQAVREGLFDMTKPLPLRLVAWLKAVFP